MPLLYLYIFKHPTKDEEVFFYAESEVAAKADYVHFYTKTTDIDKVTKPTLIRREPW